MKPISCLCFLLVITAVLSGCASGESTATPISTETQHPSITSTLIHPTATESPVPQTPTATLPPTLQPGPAQEAIRTLLQRPVDCAAPCFWGITPQQTTLGDAQALFTHLGLQLRHTDTGDGKDFYAAIYDFDDGLRISHELIAQNEIVTGLRVGIDPEPSRKGIPREWAAYSPDTLINRYGQPSEVDFSINNPPDSGGATSASYNMTIYFEKVDLIVKYDYGEIRPPITSRTACPLTNHFTLVSIWLGQNPENPPPSEAPLDKATSMTMEQFSKLMTGDPSQACFDLKAAIFP